MLSAKLTGNDLDFTCWLPLLRSLFIVRTVVFCFRVYFFKSVIAIVIVIAIAIAIAMAIVGLAVFFLTLVE
jgi:hypothetical protein